MSTPARLARNPFAIAREVTKVRIYSTELKTPRPLTHVFVKIFKFIPMPSHLLACSRVVVNMATAIKYFRPTPVCAGTRQAVGSISVYYG